MNRPSQAASLNSPLRRVVSQPALPCAVAHGGGFGTDCMEALREAKKQVIAWRDNVHDLLRGPRRADTFLAVRVGSSEFGGDGEHQASARSRLYQTRDLWTLLTLTDPAQELVIVHETLDPDVVYYYLRLGVTPGRPSLMNRLGRLRTVLLPNAGYSSSHGGSPNAYANHNLAIRLLGHVSCQNAVTSHLKQHAQRSSRPPILSLYQNSPRMEGIGKILQIDTLTTAVPLLWLGSKHGSRQIFKEAGVPLPLGINEAVKTPEALADALCALTERAPFVDKWVVKITEGTASGNGNGILDVSAMRRPIKATAEVLAALTTRLQTPMGTRRFMHELKDRGAIVEAFIAAPAGARTTSPSVQGIIDADGIVHVVSSHEQILDEATGQSYEGCCYPANAAYRAEIMRYTRLVGQKLYARGGRGNFAVDFLAVENKNYPSGWRIDAIEINLRETGTTPPFMMMQLLCGGQPDKAGAWHDAAGQQKFYVASDSIQKANLRGVRPQTVIDTVAEAGLEFTATRTKPRPAMTGVVLTLLPGVRAEGKIGCICIADSEEAARAMQKELERCLEGVGEAAAPVSGASTPRGRGPPNLQDGQDPRRRSQGSPRDAREARCGRVEN